MSLQKLHVLLFALVACYSVTVLAQQRNAGNGQFWGTVIGGVLDAVTSQISVQAQQGPPACTPYRLPEGYKSIQDYCKSLSLANDTYWDQVYRTASRPRQGQEFPLKGCIVGCVVGKDAFARGARWSAGAWSGKCIRGTQVTNLLSPTLLGASVLDVYNWTSFLPVMEQYPGTISTGPSWWETISGGFSWSVFGSSVWTITYDQTVAPVKVTEDSGALERTTALYASLVRSSRDELKLVSPGFMLGQVVMRPQSGVNPLPVPVNAGIRFALFQTCDRRSNFASGGNQRNLRGS